MNIHEFCQRFSISMKKARMLDKAGVLRLEDAAGAPDPITTMRAALMRGNALTALQLAELIYRPITVDLLGKYANRARAEIAALGDAGGEAAPREISACIFEASKGDFIELQTLAYWIRSILPDRPVGHSYIAVRLLLGTPENLRPSYVKPITSALLRARKIYGLAGWSFVDRSGHRPVTIYQRPTEIALDL